MNFFFKFHIFKLSRAFVLNATALSILFFQYYNLHALHEAARTDDNHRYLRMFLAFGVVGFDNGGVDWSDEFYQWNALHFAAFYGASICFKILLHHGAAANIDKTLSLHFYLNYLSTFTLILMYF